MILNIFRQLQIIHVLPWSQRMHPERPWSNEWSTAAGQATVGGQLLRIPLSLIRFCISARFQSIVVYGFFSLLLQAGIMNENVAFVHTIFISAGQQQVNSVWITEFPYGHSNVMMVVTVNLRGMYTNVRIDRFPTNEFTTKRMCEWAWRVQGSEHGRWTSAQDCHVPGDVAWIHHEEVQQCHAC